MQLAIQEPYMLTIQPDDFFISPRRLDENFGTMICFHRRYDLGDEHTFIVPALRVPCFLRGPFRAPVPAP